MNLQEVSAIKKLVVDKIGEDENLLKAIGNIETDFKDHSTPTIESLLNTNIFYIFI